MINCQLNQVTQFYNRCWRRLFVRLSLSEALVCKTLVVEALLCKTLVAEALADKTIVARH